MSNKLLKNSMLVMIFIILGKVFALIRDSLITAKFGATSITDIYTFALGIVYLLTTISYGLTTTFIPINSDYIQRGNKKKRNLFVNNTINTFFVFTVILTLILIICTPVIINVFAKGFTQDINTYNTAVLVTRIMLLSLVFIAIQSVLTGVLQSHNELYEPASMAFVSNIVYILYLVFLTNKFGIIGFAVATVIAFLAQLLINIPKYKKLGYSYVSYMNLKDNSLKHMIKLMIPIVISTSIIQFNLFISRSFAVNLYEGATTVLDLSNKVNTLAYEVFAIGISMIIYPILSELISKGKKKEFKEALCNGIKIVMTIMVPAAVGIAVLRVPLINILYKRGAFTEESSILTAKALLLFTPAMVAYGVRDVVNRGFYAIKNTKAPMVNGFINIIINVSLNILLWRKMGVEGLTLAFSISSIVSTILMILVLNKRLNGINLKGILIKFIKILFSATVMGIVVVFLNNFIKTIIVSEKLYSIVSIILCMIVGAIIYFRCLLLIDKKDTKVLIRLLKRDKK